MRRYTVEFGQETIDRLEELRIEHKLRNIAEVLQFAVQTLSFLDKKKQEGFSKISFVGKE